MPGEPTKSLGTTPGRKASQRRLKWENFEPYQKVPGPPNYWGIDEITEQLFGPA